MHLNYQAVIGVMGALLFALGLSLLFPMAVGLGYGEASWWGFGATAAGSLGVGALAWWRFRPQGELRIREGFAIVALAWWVLSLVGALPYVLTGVLDSYGNAFFEVMSGFTTTGATILGGGGPAGTHTATPAIEAMPNAFLFWRSLTHWLGGMGIIVLTLAVLPLLGIGGMQLFKAEVPGPSADKLTPRVAETAKRLWIVYVGFTVVQVLLLLPAMSPFDSINHAFATMATGGFSTENGSVGQYDSAYIDWVITIFMFIAGMNFALHFAALTGRSLKPFHRSQEFWLYTGFVVGTTLLMTISLYQPLDWFLPDLVGIEDGARTQYDSLADTLRYAAFQSVAIITTTGFGTADYELWPPLAVGAIFALFFIGGMAGSTGGGIKVVRVLLLVKHSAGELKRLLHPRAIIPLRLDNRVVPPDLMQGRALVYRALCDPRFLRDGGAHVFGHGPPELV